MKVIQEIGEVWFDAENDNIVLIYRNRETKMDRIVTVVSKFEIEVLIPRHLFSPSNSCLFLGFL